MTEKRNALSKVGFGIAAMFGVVWVYNFLIRPNIGFDMADWLKALVPTAVLYGLGLPLLLLIFGKSSPRAAALKSSLSAKQFLSLLSLQYTAFLFLIILSVTGIAIFGMPTGEQPAFGLDAASLFILIIFNPIVEEYVFRKLIADKVRPYGDKLFIFISAFCFSLVHGVALGLPQVVYTFVLGLIWAYALVKTENLLFPIVLHALSNFLNNTVPLLLGDSAGLYTMLSLLIGLVAFVLLLAKRKNISIEGSAGILNAKDAKLLVTSPGLLFYTLFTAAVMVAKALVLQ